jgi:hypothetical protein
MRDLLRWRAMWTRYMNTWRALLAGDAEEQVVVRANFFGQVLAIAGCTMLAVSVVGLLLQ